jgi:cytochrome c553
VNKIGLWGVLVTGGLVFFGSLLAFLWLPRAELGPDVPLLSAWYTALGLSGRDALQSLLTVVRVTPTSEVVLNHQLLQSHQDGDVGLGATLALRCTMCHGPTGIRFAGAPNLAGQYPVVIYKQLRDYQSGARSSAVMTVMARALSDTEIRRLALYYASLPRLPLASVGGEVPAIVKWGAPMRNIAPCGSCHGDLDHTLASPWLAGEPASYIRTQLHAFAGNDRVNDINGQMRAMAQTLTPEEIDTAAAYYAGGIP